MRKLIVLILILLLAGCSKEFVFPIIEDVEHQGDSIQVEHEGESYKLKLVGNIDQWSLYESEQGMCEAFAYNPVYINDNGETWYHGTNAGCNPPWINGHSIFISINGVLMTIQEAADQGYLHEIAIDEYFEKKLP